jgi:hypothetical protein
MPPTTKLASDRSCAKSSLLSRKDEGGGSRNDEEPQRSIHGADAIVEGFVDEVVESGFGDRRLPDHAQRRRLFGRMSNTRTTESCPFGARESSEQQRRDHVCGAPIHETLFRSLKFYSAYLNYVQTETRGTGTEAVFGSHRDAATIDSFFTLLLGDGSWRMDRGRGARRLR